MREEIEYRVVWVILRVIGGMPQALGRGLAYGVGLLAYLLLGKLRRVGLRNLEIAFPNLGLKEKKRVLRKLYMGLGRQLVEFCLFPKYTRENVEEIAVYEGFENYDRARAQGKGVFFLTGHFGGWEVGSFATSVYGNPLRIVIRELDNPKVNALVNRYRTLHGNTLMDNRDFVRGLIGAVRAGETVGILMDTNMTPPQGVFVDYFGELACTASGMAKIASRTGAAVLPAYTIWDEVLRKYKIIFEPALTLTFTGDAEADALANTAMFTKKLEEVARRYPEQWLWVHRRWKTRPEGGRKIYCG
ncbi:MAG: lysophospholipid acyltransferase family protein [Acidobacteriaceae bacterium]